MPKLRDEVCDLRAWLTRVSDRLTVVEKSAKATKERVDAIDGENFLAGDQGDEMARRLGLLPHGPSTTYIARQWHRLEARVETAEQSLKSLDARLPSAAALDAVRTSGRLAERIGELEKAKDVSILTDRGLANLQLKVETLEFKGLGDVRVKLHETREDLDALDDDVSALRQRVIDLEDDVQIMGPTPDPDAPSGANYTWPAGQRARKTDGSALTDLADRIARTEDQPLGEPLFGLVRFRELIPLHEAEEAIRQAWDAAVEKGVGRVSLDELLAAWRERRKG